MARSSLMVSRVYTPLITPYQRSHNAGNGRAPVNSEEGKKPGWTPQAPIQPETGDAERQSAGLKAVQYNQFQKIPLSDVIHDFKNTMSALGVDANTQTEIAAYLNVVRLQAGKDQPEISFIKHTLKTAANSLDQYIGKALNQPSKVVKEWVDALLMQDIDYKADIPLEEAPVTTVKPDEQPIAETPQDEPGLVKASAKSRLKSLIEEAKAEQQQKNYDLADEKLQSALDLLADKDKPEWEGKVWGLRGRIYDQAGQWEKAVNAFDEAAVKFERANLPQKQSSALHAVASLLEDHGELQKAKGYYQQVLALDERHGKPEHLLRSLNDLGSIALRTGDTTQAIQSLQKAANLMADQRVSPAAQSDIQANLAAAYRKSQAYDKAIETYRHSLDAAKQAKDRSRYNSGLQQLASVYVEANQPEQAMKVLQRLKRLG